MAPVQNFSSMFARDAVDHRTRQPLLVGVAVGLCVLSFAIGALRIALRLKRRTTSWEDGFITVAIVFSILQSVTACMAAQNGYGRPVATLTREQLSEALMWFWWAQITYKLTIWPTKLSILFLYRRVFGDTPNVTSFGIKFRTAVYTLMGFSGAFCTICLVVNIFTCIPVKYYWNKSIHGTCGINSLAWWFTQSLLSTISDLVILVMPMPLVKNLLNVPLRQKLGLCGVFGLGSFVVVVTIVRMTTLKTNGLGADTTYDGAITLSWSIVETNVAIICASLPLLRPLIARLIPGFCGRSSVRSNSYSMAHRNTGSQSGSKPVVNHANQIRTCARPRPRSWAGIETVIVPVRQGLERSPTEGWNSGPGIHKQTDVEIITEAASIGSDSLRRLTESGLSKELRDSGSTR